MLKYFLNWLLYHNKIKLATSVEEKESVYRFRYKIYVELMNIKLTHNVDHEKKMMYNTESEGSEMLMIYAGSLPHIFATLTFEIWPRGKVPPSIKNKYSLNLFSNCEDIIVVQLHNAIVDPKYQRKDLFPLLFSYAIIQCSYSQSIDLILGCCRPGLINYYQKFGFRFSTEKLIQYPNALVAPFYFVPYEAAYFQKIKSPMIYFLRSYLKNIHLSTIQKQHIEIANKFFSLGTAVCTDQEGIYNILKNYYKDLKLFNLLDFITLDELNRMCHLIINVEESRDVYTENIEDREIYIILEGSFAVIVNGVIIKTLTTGNIFGEIAFFLGCGRRVASIRSLSSGKLAILARNDINRIIKRDSKLAIKILFTMSRILSMKLADTTRVVSNRTKK